MYVCVQDSENSVLYIQLSYAINTLRQDNVSVIMEEFNKLEKVNKS